MIFKLFMIFICLIKVQCDDMKQNDCESIQFTYDSTDSADVYVICKGNFAEMDSLKQYLENITDRITIFELGDAKLDVLPPDIFLNVQKTLVEKIIFTNVTMDLLSIPKLGPPPFGSIRNTVVTLEIYNSSNVFAWDFGSLEFANLRNIIIENSDLISITTPLTFWHHLRFIQLQNCSIRWIHKNAFATNTKLTICSLTHNKITRISRSMFPQPATKLYSIDLSFNRLEWLPDDAFANMVMLRELKLDNNRLKDVSAKILDPVWNNLTQLWIDGNNIYCSNLCWMAEKMDKPIFLESSSCKTNRNLKFVDSYFEHCKK